MKNPKPEIRRPKEARSPKSEKEITLPGGLSDFAIRIYFGFRHSDFGFAIV
jgi:hypothetical protein